jgi:type II secretion system protein C
MGRLGIRIANVALFTLSCFLVAQVFNQLAVNLLLPTQRAVTVDAAGTTTRAPSWDERKSIIDRNLFGARVATPPPAPPPVEDEPELEETRLPLQLLGTTASTDPSLSTAAILDKTKREHQVVVVGDPLDNHQRVTVAAIERRRVVLQNGSRREELLLEDDPAAKAPSRPRKKPATSRRSAARKPRAPSPLADRLKELQSGSSDPRSARQLFSDARLLPSYDEEGQMNGVRVNAIKEGSMYEKMGLNDGDVIKGLNGIEITNPSASSKVLGELQRAEQFKVTGVRENGETFIKEWDAGQLADLLSELSNP